MSLLVDTPRHPAHGRVWAHLVSDTSLEELHGFAARLGVPRRAFEGDHYDLHAELVERAVALGARPVGTREVLAALAAAGLRTPKRRGEKVLATRTARPEEAPLLRVDVVRAAAVPVPRAAPLVLGAGPAGPLLGFRRRWYRTPDGRRRVVHDPLHDSRHDPVREGPDATVPAGEDPAGTRWSALLEVSSPDAP